MKLKILIAVVAAFGAPYLIWGPDIAVGMSLALIGAGAFIDVLVTKRGRKYELSAIEGTFRATASGNDLKDVQKELDRALKQWRMTQQ